MILSKHPRAVLVGLPTNVQNTLAVNPKSQSNHLNNLKSSSPTSSLPRIGEREPEGTRGSGKVVWEKARKAREGKGRKREGGGGDGGGNPRNLFEELGGICGSTPSAHITPSIIYFRDPVLDKLLDRH